MSNQPHDEPRHLLGPSHPIVAVAVEALRAFGDDLDRVTVAILLPAWRHARELSDREFRSVLAAFPAPSDTPAESWLSDANLGMADARAIAPLPEKRSYDDRLSAVCEHCGRTVALVGGRFAHHERPEGDWCRDSGRPARPEPR
jgi:hypothetical protein